MTRTPADILKSAKDFAQGDNSDYHVAITKTAVNAAMLGAVGGAIVGYYKRYNMYASILVGMVVCSFAATQFIKTQRKDDDDDQID